MPCMLARREGLRHRLPVTTVPSELIGCADEGCECHAKEFHCVDDEEFDQMVSDRLFFKSEFCTCAQGHLKPCGRRQLRSASGEEAYLYRLGHPQQAATALVSHAAEAAAWISSRPNMYPLFFEDDGVRLPSMFPPGNGAGGSFNPSLCLCTVLLFGSLSCDARWPAVHYSPWVSPGWRMTGGCLWKEWKNHL